VRTMKLEVLDPIPMLQMLLEVHTLIFIY